MKMRVENWCGYEIRFVEQYGEWWAILKDVCDALGLRTAKISERLDPDMMLRVEVERDYIRPTKYRKENYDIPSKYNVNSEVLSKDVSNYEDGSNDIVKSKHTYRMLAVNEIGIYEALYTSRKLEARKFRRWSGNVMKKLRSSVGLQGYEVMRMTEPEVQEQIDHIIDTLFVDPETGVLMQSITVQGGDVEQVPFIR